MRWQRRAVRALHDCEMVWNLRHYGRQSRTAVARFVLDAIAWIGVVARGDHRATSRTALPHEEGNRRGGTGLVRQKSGRAAGGHHFGSGSGDLVRGEAMVIADDDTLARIFASHDVARDSLCHDARVCERKIFRDDATPAIGAQLDRSHRKLSRVYAKQ